MRKTGLVFALALLCASAHAQFRAYFVGLRTLKLVPTTDRSVQVRLEGDYLAGCAIDARPLALDVTAAKVTFRMNLPCICAGDQADRAAAFLMDARHRPKTRMDIGSPAMPAGNVERMRLEAGCFVVID